MDAAAHSPGEKWRQKGIKEAKVKVAWSMFVEGFDWNVISKFTDIPAKKLKKKQASETVLDPLVLKREIAPFSKLTNRHPRILITKDRADYSTEGIRHISYYDFLLGSAFP